MATTVLATTATGTSSDYSFSSSVTDYSLYGFATSAGTNTRTYNTVDALKTSNTTLAYAILYKSVSATFYYYNGSSQATTTNSGTQIVDYTDSVLSESTIATPSVVSSSTGPNGSNYMGLSITAGSTTTTTTITTANTKYYAVYGGSYTASFTKFNNNVSSIGSTSLSCSSSYTTDEISYSGSPCSIMLPSITAATGYAFQVWSGGYITGAGSDNNEKTGAAVTANKSITATFVDSSALEGDLSPGQLSSEKI